MSKATMRLTNADSVELTLTISMPVHAWERVRDGNNWNQFSDTVSMALRKVRDISGECPVDEQGLR